MTTTSAPEILTKAANLLAERGKQYDTGKERSMAKTVRAFNAITGHDLSEQDGWYLLLILKGVRQYQNPGKAHVDSLEDSVAYAALWAESFMSGSGEGK